MPEQSALTASESLLDQFPMSLLGMHKTPSYDLTKIAELRATRTRQQAADGYVVPWRGLARLPDIEIGANISASCWSSKVLPMAYRETRRFAGIADTPRPAFSDDAQP